MRLSLCFMTLALGATVGSAQDADPLHSTACVQALDALQAQEAALAAAARQNEGAGERVEPAMRSALQTLRRRAARDCLGSQLDAPPPVQQRLLQPPVSGASAAPPPATWHVTPPAAAAAPPPIRIPPLRTITACDPMGCWANDGTRLQRIGSTLYGPLGLCTVQGAVLSCP